MASLKFWLTDLQVSWLNESEDNAERARAALEGHLQTVGEFAPDEAAKVLEHVESLVGYSIEAVDAYVDENRVLGNSIGAKGRSEIQAADDILLNVVDKLKQEAQTGRDAAIADGDRTLILSIAVLIAATLFGLLLTWLILRSILGPLKNLVIVMIVLANGNRSIEIPARDKKDEIGEIAGAVQIFKDNAIETERFREQQTEQEKQAESERNEAAKEARVSLANNLDEQIGGMLDTVSSAATQMEATATSLISTAEETSRQAGAVSAASEEASTNVQTVASAS